MFKTKTNKRVTVNKTKRRSVNDGVVLTGSITKDGAEVSPTVLPGHTDSALDFVDNMKGSLVCIIKLNYSHGNAFTQDVIIGNFTIKEPLTITFIETLLSNLVNKSTLTVGKVETFKHEFYISTSYAMDSVLEHFNLTSLKPLSRERNPSYLTI